MRRLHGLAAAPSTLRAASCIGLEKIEILVVLPGGRLVALPYPGLLEPLGKPARLVALEFEVIIDKYVAELADPVLQSRGLISRRAEHADHDAAVVVTP